MADLPADRLSTEPPFTNVGLDVFGPWTVSSRWTRGGLAQRKWWAVLFTCMSVRAVHIEVIKSLDTSSFINALRRFLTIRGPVKHIRSDRGTNFVSGAQDSFQHQQRFRGKVSVGPRLHMDVQSSACLPHGWYMGKNDWCGKKNLGLYVPAAWDIKADPQSTLHTDGGSGCYHQRQTSYTCVHRSR